MIDERNLFDQTVRNNIIPYENIRKVATGQGDYYTTFYLLDYSYFKENYKLTFINLIKQQTLDTDRKTIQQINLTGSKKCNRSNSKIIIKK